MEKEEVLAEAATRAGLSAPLTTASALTQLETLAGAVEQYLATLAEELRLEMEQHAEVVEVLPGVVGQAQTMLTTLRPELKAMQYPPPCDDSEGAPPEEGDLRPATTAELLPSEEAYAQALSAAQRETNWVAHLRFAQPCAELLQQLAPLLPSPANLAAPGDGSSSGSSGKAFVDAIEPDLDSEAAAKALKLLGLARAWSQGLSPALLEQGTFEVLLQEISDNEGRLAHVLARSALKPTPPLRFGALWDDLQQRASALPFAQCPSSSLDGAVSSSGSLCSLRERVQEQFWDTVALRCLESFRRRLCGSKWFTDTLLPEDSYCGLPMCRLTALAADLGQCAAQFLEDASDLKRQGQRRSSRAAHGLAVALLRLHLHG
eukprot:RCo048374